MNSRTLASLLSCIFIAVLATALAILPIDRAYDLLAPRRAASVASWLNLLSFGLSNQGFRDDDGFALPRATSGWNLFYHLGGNGPWIEKRDARFGTYTEGGNPPTGCLVDQVHMVGSGMHPSCQCHPALADPFQLSRHAERYPTKKAGSRHLSLLSRLETIPLNGSLAFLNNGNWSYFISPSTSSDRTFEDLTTTSPYAGTLSAFSLGTTFRTRYSHLLTIRGQKPVNFWSASSPRDVESALYFADGLFGRDWSSPNASNPAKMQVISESKGRGGNTLTPSETCLNYISDSSTGHDQGYVKLAEWQKVFSRPISARLSAPNPALDPPMSAVEVYSMMELCGFETLVRGSSPWCEIFTPLEWEHFAYARDVLHFYRAGPGNRFSETMGSLWLNATADLLAQESKPASQHEGEAGDDGGEIYASFVHDSDIVPVIAALGIFDEDDDGEGEATAVQQQQSQMQSLPTDHMKQHRNWRTSDIVPMAGHLVIERLNCRTPHGWHYRDVRLFINDGRVGWPVPKSKQRSTNSDVEADMPPNDDRVKNQEAQGGKKDKKVSVPQIAVNRFVDMARQISRRNSFTQLCGIDDEHVDDRITFLHQQDIRYG